MFGQVDIKGGTETGCETFRLNIEGKSLRHSPWGGSLGQRNIMVRDKHQSVGAQVRASDNDTIV